MRVLFGVLSLLVVVAVVGVLAKKQLSATQHSIPALAVPATTSSDTDVGVQPGKPVVTVREQSQQMQQQYKQALESAMQQPRPMPDEKP